MRTPRTEFDFQAIIPLRAYTCDRFCGPRYAWLTAIALLGDAIPSLVIDEHSTMDDPARGIISKSGRSVTLLTRAVRETLETIQTKGNIDMRPYENIQLGGSDRIFRYEQAQQILILKVADYRRSLPGPFNSPENIDFRALFNMIELGLPVPATEIVRFTRTLDYRQLDIMSKATAYKNFVDPGFPDCDVYDAFAHVRDLRPGTPEEKIYRVARWELIAAKLFDPPTADEGVEYMKGVEYLAVMMAAQLWPPQRVQASIRTFTWEKNYLGKIPYTIRTLGLLNGNEIRAVLASCASRFNCPLTPMLE